MLFELVYKLIPTLISSQFELKTYDCMRRRKFGGQLEWAGKGLDTGNKLRETVCWIVIKAWVTKRP